MLFRPFAVGGGGLFAKHQIFFEIVHKRFSADSIGFTVLFVLFTYHRSSFHPSLFIAAPFTAVYQRELDTGILTEDTLTKKIDDDIDKTRDGRAYNHVKRHIIENRLGREKTESINFTLLECLIIDSFEKIDEFKMHETKKLKKLCEKRRKKKIDNEGDRY